MPRLKELVFPFVLVLCIASFSHAQPDIVCKPGDIQGRIVDEAGAPVAGAKVLVQNAPYTQDLRWYTTRPEEDLLLGEATSDADGKYRIEWRVKQVSAIKNTSVTADILVMKPNYAIAFRQTTLWSEHYHQFKLTPDVEHVGQVLDDQGKPLADAEVRLDAIYKNAEWVNRGAVFSSERVLSLIGSSLRPRVKTNKDGTYRLRGLASGQIALLQVTHPAFPPIRRMQPANEKSPESISEQHEGKNIFAAWYNSYRKPLQMVAGRLGKIVAIEETTDKPIANLEVCRDSYGLSAKSDQNGNLEYWLPEKKPENRAFGHYEYYARRAGDQGWSPAFPTLGEGESPAKLLVPILRTITGQVRDKETNKGIEGVGVYFSHPNEKKRWTLTDSEGKYILPTSNKLTKIAVCGPTLGYDLPVDKWTSSPEEASRNPDAAIHQCDIRFQADQLSVDVDFTIQKYPKVQVRVVDGSGNRIRRTQVKLCPNFTVVPRPAIAQTNDDGIAEFEIDRPIIKSTTWVANSDGFGVTVIEGMPEGITTLTVEPTIAIRGLLTAKATDGKLRNAIGVPIYLKPIESQKYAQIDLATTDKNGHFTIYLPAESQEEASLFVPRINESSIYDWSVELNEGARADFVMDDDRLP